MNLILIILLAAVVLLIVTGLVALAWGIAHAPEGHEDEAGFHFDPSTASDELKPLPPVPVSHDSDHPLGTVEPALF